MKSEFDPYLNMTYVKLSGGAGFCLENSRFLKGRTVSQAIDDLEESAEKTDAIASDAIDDGSIEILDSANRLENQIDGVIAKLELAIIGAKYLEN